MSLEIDRSWRSMFVGLLAPDTCADLIDHLAARRRFRAAAALVPSGLYSLDEFEATLASASTPSSHIRLARRGRPLSPLLYCRDVGGGIQTEAVLRLREQGVSIVINRLHELTPSVAAAVSALREIGRAHV